MVFYFFVLFCKFLRGRNSIIFFFTNNVLIVHKYKGKIKNSMVEIKREGGVKMTVAMSVKKTLADLKGSKATLKIYSLQAANEEAKEIYKETTDVMEDIISDLERRVKTLEFEEPQYKGF